MFHGYEAALVQAEQEIARLKVEGSPGVMHEVDRAFYDLAIKERDCFSAENTRLGETLDSYIEIETARRCRACRELERGRNCVDGLCRVCRLTEALERIAHAHDEHIELMNQDWSRVLSWAQDIAKNALHTVGK